MLNPAQMYKLTKEYKKTNIAVAKAQRIPSEIKKEMAIVQSAKWAEQVFDHYIMEAVKTGKLKTMVNHSLFDDKSKYLDMPGDYYRRIGDAFILLYHNYINDLRDNHKELNNIANYTFHFDMNLAKRVYPLTAGILRALDKYHKAGYTIDFKFKQRNSNDSTTEIYFDWSNQASNINNIDMSSFSDELEELQNAYRFNTNLADAQTRISQLEIELSLGNRLSCKNKCTWVSEKN